ncbi:hypothetical protein SLNSH_23935 [Alsobacter soli]|uniref:Uncharacterized protein n=1 Tax=Alsobacter soli TaxID=2109933 RepID=A0A2T1HLC5_9HYPH|nr:hypothetical protein SLNSH_23935 [Alsobacter soli]
MILAPSGKVRIRSTSRATTVASWRVKPKASLPERSVSTTSTAPGAGRAITCTASVAGFLRAPVSSDCAWALLSDLVVVAMPLLTHMIEQAIGFHVSING